MCQYLSAAVTFLLLGKWGSVTVTEHSRPPGGGLNHDPFDLGRDAQGGESDLTAPARRIIFNVMSPTSRQTPKLLSNSAIHPNVDIQPHQGNNVT